MNGGEKAAFGLAPPHPRVLLLPLVTMRVAPRAVAVREYWPFEYEAQAGGLRELCCGLSLTAFITGRRPSLVVSEPNGVPVLLLFAGPLSRYLSRLLS
jgi:hypothetical protein